MYESQTIPCGLCAKPTFMLSTKRCDPCWELEKRIQDRPELARQILNRVEAEAGRPEREPWPSEAELADDGYECDGTNCPPRAHDHKVLL